MIALPADPETSKTPRQQSGHKENAPKSRRFQRRRNLRIPKNLSPPQSATKVAMTALAPVSVMREAGSSGSDGMAARDETDAG